MATYQRIVFLMLLCTASMHAQDRPYLFTVMPAGTVDTGVLLNYDAAYGEKTFEPFGADRMEQNIGIRARIAGPITLLAHAGLATSTGSQRTMQQAELVGDILDGRKSFVNFSAGVGMRHEYAGTNVLLGRVLIGRQFAAWNVTGNLLLEKAFSSERDGIDLMTTLGCAYRLSEQFQIGIEAVGQDLEGFWDEEEAEGGATLFAGPSVGYTSPGAPVHITLGGGPILRATQSGKFSGALRDIPVESGSGFVIRTSVSVAL